VAEAGPVDLLLLDQAVPAPLFRDGGRMTRAALAALDAWLARRDRDRPLVAAGHYPLRGPHGLPLRPGRALGRAEALEARLAEAGVALYLCGHIHAPYRLDPPACPVPLRCAGSSTAKGTVALYRVGPDVLEEERLPAEVEAEAAETSGPSGFTPRSS
jgi:hypothetical protein